MCGLHPTLVVGTSSCGCVTGHRIYSLRMFFCMLMNTYLHAKTLVIYCIGLEPVVSYHESSLTSGAEGYLYSLCMS